MNNFGEKADFIWPVADLFRGPYRPNQYKDVMLPLTVLRRITGVPFCNTSRYTFEELIRRFNEASNEEAGDHFTPREVIRLYGQLADSNHVRIFDNADFGYQRITVERPLRLNFAVDEQRLARLQEAKPFTKLATSRKRKDTKAAQAESEAGRKEQEAILAALRTLAGQGVVKDRETFSKQMKAAFKTADLKVPAALRKAILMALAERDEMAKICTDAKGNPEPDPELRDYENVPLTEGIDDYMRREVLPHVPDAWIDESKTKIGYEINFNRYFYQYTPPRPLDEIETDFKQIEGEIADMLAEVTE